VDSETLKIVLFIGAVLAAAAVARVFFGGEARRDPNAPPLPLEPEIPEPDEPEEDEEDRVIPAAVGSELPFPAAAADAMRKIPPDERPKITNYLFRTIDLVNGPPDPTDFLDEFIVQSRNEDGSLTTDSIVVTTPAALERILREEKRHAIFATRYLIVDRFNVGEILTGWIKMEGTSADRTSEVPAGGRDN
jgi:hypothetical protein